MVMKNLTFMIYRNFLGSELWIEKLPKNSGIKLAEGTPHNPFMIGR